MLRAALLVLLVPACVLAYLTQPLICPATPRTELDTDPARLAKIVRALTTTLGPRDASHVKELDGVAAFLGGQLGAAGGRVSEQPFDVDGHTYRNVIASFGPEDGERVVVGAHYDTAGARPGADDDASGVAGLLELARLLGDASVRARFAPLAARVDLVAFTLEEPPYFATPHMGSAVHARSLRADGVRLRAMISLEMIGCFSDAPDSQRLPVSVLEPFYPSHGNFIAVVGEMGGGWLVRRIKGAMSGASELPVRSLNAPHAAPGIDLSDHRNYWDAGYDAVMITDTAFFRNDHYHENTDTADTLDYRRMAQVVQGVHAAVLELAR
jgi:Peptidase family M28